jgi:hypothetical protein
MKTKDKDNLIDAVFEEHERMVKHHLWRADLKTDMPNGAEELTSTWTMKKKASGRYISRLNVRGYGQVDGEHYNSTNIYSPVTNNAAIIVIMVLTIIFRWSAGLIDVQCACLGRFQGW